MQFAYKEHGSFNFEFPYVNWLKKNIYILDWEFSTNLRKTIVGRNIQIIRVA